MTDTLAILLRVSALIIGLTFVWFIGPFLKGSIDHHKVIFVAYLKIFSRSHD